MLLNKNKIKLYILIIICIISFFLGMRFSKNNNIKENFNNNLKSDINLYKENSINDILMNRNNMKSRKIGNGGLCVPSLNERFREIRFNNNNCKDICNNYSDCIGFTNSSEGKKINVNINKPDICSSVCFSGVKDKIPRHSTCSKAINKSDNKEYDCSKLNEGESICECISSPSCHIFIKNDFNRQYNSANSGNKSNNNNLIISNPSLYNAEQCFSSHLVNNNSLLGNNNLKIFPTDNNLNKECAADYNSNKPCCFQKGGKVNKDFICPVTNPICQNYIHNKNWGKCV